MILGFTGTQVGMTAVQYAECREVLLYLKVTELHHGDCIGADAHVHRLATELGLRRIIHPPENVAKRAWCTGDAVTEAKPYLARNRDIVDVTTALLATPQGPEELRSGTWSTVRYARRQTKPLVIVWPVGSTTWES